MKKIEIFYAVLEETIFQKTHFRIVGSHQSIGGEQTFTRRLYKKWHRCKLYTSIPFF